MSSAGPFGLRRVNGALCPKIFNDIRLGWSGHGYALIAGRIRARPSWSMGARQRVAIRNRGYELNGRLERMHYVGGWSEIEGPAAFHALRKRN
jgi:hypothetical protein